MSTGRDNPVVIIHTKEIPENIRYVANICRQGDYDGRRDIGDSEVAYINVTPYDIQHHPSLADVERIHVAFEKGSIR